MSNINVLNQGVVRQGSRRAFTNGGQQSFDLNLGGDVLFAQGLPERAEIVRMGRSFSAQIPAASGFTLLITIPSTRAELALQNPNSVASRTCLVIDRFWVKAVTSMASAGELTPLSQLVPAGTALVADNAAVLRVNLAGKAAAPTGTLCIASTATGCITDKWNHHAGRSIPETTNIAALVEVQCYGKYIVPPLGNFSMNAQESVSGGTAIMGVEWHEIELDLG
jgi:hypothetical protein